MAEYLLEVKNLQKTFHGGTVNETAVFHDFSMGVKAGQFVSIVGSNGSGKTTLLSLLCGSLPLDGGQVLLDGQRIDKLPEHVRARKIGRVFQDPAKGACGSLTILENMALADNKGKGYGLGFGVSRKRIDYYRTQLERLHLGLEDKIRMPVGVLSGGQRQALALLMATLSPLELLVLDEHTAALDPKSSQTVMELTDQLVKEKGLTALMVTHNLRFAVEHGNRLMMMHEGRAVIDAADDDKKQYQIDDLLKVFNEISIECGN